MPSATPKKIEVPKELAERVLKGDITIAQMVGLKRDTLYAIAVRFKVTLAQILAANPSITNPSQITIGQRIAIPTP